MAYIRMAVWAAARLHCASSHIGARLAEIVAIFADNRQLSMAHFRSVQEQNNWASTLPTPFHCPLMRSNTRRS